MPAGQPCLYARACLPACLPSSQQALPSATHTAAPFPPTFSRNQPTPPQPIPDVIPPSAGNLGFAIAFNEALEIVRLPFAVATVPFITSWWERLTGPPGTGKKP